MNPHLYQSHFKAALVWRWPGQVLSYISWELLNLENEVRDTIVKVIVNEKPVVNIDIKATTPNVFVPNRIEHLIELENFEMINKKILI